MNTTTPTLSGFFQKKEHIIPALRGPMNLLDKRKQSGEEIDCINLAIGNIKTPTHPAVQNKLKNFLEQKELSVPYTATPGLLETQQAFLNEIHSFGFETNNLKALVLNGASDAIRLILQGTCSQQTSFLGIEPIYTNYLTIAEELDFPVCSIQRTLNEDGTFSLPSIESIEEKIKSSKPSALVVIPYDNPTGQFFDHEKMCQLAKLCVKYNMWMISDEAYRGLYYLNDLTPSSIWKITDQEVPGIEKRRISLESASKTFNLCGGRIGAVVTDNPHFYDAAVKVASSYLCSNLWGQIGFSALKDLLKEEIQDWIKKQKDYYEKMISDFSTEIKNQLPQIIISAPQAAIYSVLDVKNMVPENFKGLDFLRYCAEKGGIDINGKKTTLLLAPMSGFYTQNTNGENPGNTQFRIAFVETPEVMKQVPTLLKQLLADYLEE